jgi:hypothetical protein
MNNWESRSSESITAFAPWIARTLHPQGYAVLPKASSALDGMAMALEVMARAATATYAVTQFPKPL